MVDYNNLHGAGFAARKKGENKDACPVDRRTHANGYVRWIAGWNQANNICANLPAIVSESTSGTTNDTCARLYQQAAAKSETITLTIPKGLGK